MSLSAFFRAREYANSFRSRVLEKLADLPGNFLGRFLRGANVQARNNCKFASPC